MTELIFLCTYPHSLNAKNSAPSFNTIASGILWLTAQETASPEDTITPFPQTHTHHLYIFACIASYPQKMDKSLPCPCSLASNWENRISFTTFFFFPGIVGYHWLSCLWPPTKSKKKRKSLLVWDLNTDCKLSCHRPLLAPETSFWLSNHFREFLPTNIEGCHHDEQNPFP